MSVDIPCKEESQENKNQNATANIPNIDFPYADINGNLKLQLKENFSNKKVFTVKSKDELHSLFEKFNWELPADNEDANEIVS